MELYETFEPPGYWKPYMVPNRSIDKEKTYIIRKSECPKALKVIQKLRDGTDSCPGIVADIYDIPYVSGYRIVVQNKPYPFPQFRKKRRCCMWWPCSS